MCCYMNKIYVFNSKNELLLCGKKFYFLEEIKPIEINKIIDVEKIKYYRDIRKLNLVKSLLNDGYTTDEVENLKFCKFKLTSNNIDYKSGVYIWVINKEIIYVGEAKNIKKRFNNGYGTISPRNIFEGGQSTNCKMNRVVLDNYQKKLKYIFVNIKSIKN